MKTTFDFHHIMIFLPQNQMGAAEGLYFYSMNDFLNDYLPDDQLINPGTDSIWFYQPNLKLPFILSQADSENDVIACCRVLRNQSSQELEYAYLIFLNPYEFSNILQETFQIPELPVISYRTTEKSWHIPILPNVVSD